MEQNLVFIKPHPNCARLVFSFTMANGTEDFVANIEEYRAMILSVVAEAAAKIGHGSNGRFEAIVPRSTERS